MRGELLICAAAAIAFTASAADAQGGTSDRGTAAETHGQVTVANDAVKWGQTAKNADPYSALMPAALITSAQVFVSARMRTASS